MRKIIVGVGISLCSGWLSAYTACGGLDEDALPDLAGGEIVAADTCSDFCAQLSGPLQREQIGCLEGGFEERGHTFDTPSCDDLENVLAGEPGDVTALCNACVAEQEASDDTCRLVSGFCADAPAGEGEGEPGEGEGEPGEGEGEPGEGEGEPGEGEGEPAGVTSCDDLCAALDDDGEVSTIQCIESEVEEAGFSFDDSSCNALEDAIASGFGSVELLCNACVAAEEVTDGVCVALANSCL